MSNPQVSEACLTFFKTMMVSLKKNLKKFRSEISAIGGLMTITKAASVLYEWVVYIIHHL